MLLSSPSSPKPPEPKSILLIGPHGGGKTALAMQFPFPAFVDCDKNLDGPDRFIRTQRKDLEYGYIQATLDKTTGQPIPIDQIYDNIMRSMDEIKTEPRIKTVILDGLTLINEYIIQKVLKDSGKSEMEMRNWQPFKTKLLNLLVGKLRQLGKTTIVTCHEDPDERQDKTNMAVKITVAIKPAIQGGIKDQLGGLFTDVWRCTSMAAPGGKVDYKIQTVRDALSDLKNSMGMPNEILVRQGELAWTKIEPYVKGLV